LQCLFRPEEVNNPSATTGKEYGRAWLDARQLPSIEYDVNAGCALRRGIIYNNFFVCEFAADQQHKINRSVGVELAATGKRDFMKKEI